MKTRYILSILAATAIFAGCAKENASENIPELGENQFFATIEDGAKTILNRATGDNYNKIFWEDGDIVNINGSHYTVDPLEEDPRRALFTLDEGETAPTQLPYKAYYPYDLGSIILPSSYTYDTENPFRGVFPMYAVSAGSRNLMFKNICGLLEIKLTGTDKIMSLTVTDESKPLSGTFTIDEDYNAKIKVGTGGITIDCGEGVSLGLSTPTVFYVPVPKGIYTKLTVSATKEGGEEWSIDAKNEARVERNEVYQLNFALSSKEVLPGQFSVSYDKQVRFPVGNVYCDNEGTWAFEATQFDFRTIPGGPAVINGESKTTPAGHQGLFSWSTSNNEYGLLLDDKAHTGTFFDWSHAFGGEESIWHTPTFEEWFFLISFNDGTHDFSNPIREGKRKDNVTINSVMHGMVLVPDDWTGGAIKDSYTLDEWKEMETKGAVCLPYAGYWKSNVQDTGRKVFVWSSSGETAVNPTNAWRLGSVTDGYEIKVYAASIARGFSVRLATDKLNVPVLPTSIELNKSSLTLGPGETFQLKGTILPLYATDKSLAWTSSNPEVATVDDSGLVTALSGGSATITCTSNARGSVTNSCMVTVESTHFVDLGCSVLWADRNVGAVFVQDAGTYYFWAAIEKVYTSLSAGKFTFVTSKPDPDRYANHSWSAGSGFYNGNTPYINGSVNNYTKYKTYSTTQSETLELMDDVAYQTLGEGCRMPTMDELNELVNNCDLSAVTVNDVACIKFTSKANPDKFIYFPMTGEGEGLKVTNPTTVTYIMSSQTSTSYEKRVKALQINSNASCGEIGNLLRSMGHSVRAVKVKPAE